MVEISQNIKEPTEAMKGLQGHLTLFLNRTLFFCVNFKIEVGFCEHLPFSF